MLDKINKGDTIELEGTLGENITGWKIRCEIYDRKGSSIKLATANSGGSDEQIEVTDASNGVFEVKVAKGLTELFEDKGCIEIEVETNDTPTKIFTALQDEIEFKCSRIKWETPS